MTAAIPALQPVAGTPGDNDTSWWPSRAAILTAATKLFALRGFAGDGMDAVGATVGIAGPSVYNHFASKAEILIALLNQGTGILEADLRRDLARSTGPADALRRLLASYSEFAFENAPLIKLLLTFEADQLALEQCHRLRAARSTPTSRNGCSSCAKSTRIRTLSSSCPGPGRPEPHQRHRRDATSAVVREHRGHHTTGVRRDSGNRVAPGVGDYEGDESGARPTIRREAIPSASMVIFSSASLCGREKSM
ncbi:TetR/AcrR family transcriptional regulator [Nocardia sp. CA-107356]|uniref:TetR/AcrR family transcriptional regulator n=1 Tax=Nocardia sp. CA-107356 TaxID=3239972 RepID=UPI003D89DE70